MTQQELKHLDYIQSTITRMATNQFQIKSWYVTIITALLAFFGSVVSNTDSFNPYLLFVAVFPTVVFWILDSHFLSIERRLRRIYMDVAENSEGIKTFDMPLNKYKKGKYTLISCMFSLGNFLLYFSMLLIVVGAFIFIIAYR